MAVVGAAFLHGVGWWLDFSDEPQKSEMIVVLSGQFTRPFHAADLYRQGYAPEVWLSRPKVPDGPRLAREAGIPFPLEEDVDREILIRRGVPAASIHLYGNGVLSTVDEALSLARATDVRGKRILVVTSRHHARRARLIFRSVLKGSEVRVVGTPYEKFTRRWWSDRSMADSAVLECAKLLYYLAGGRFVSSKP